MLLLLADEDLTGALVRAIQRHSPVLDIVRAQDVGLMSTPDPEILEWAAANRRIVVTHDVSTMTAHAYQRVHAGLVMSGVVVVSRQDSIATILDGLSLMADCSHVDEWQSQVVYLPL